MVTEPSLNLIGTEVLRGPRVVPAMQLHRLTTLSLNLADLQLRGISATPIDVGPHV